MVNILEQKWLEGKDRPYNGSRDGMTTYAYADVKGDLFGQYGPDIKDIRQGADGDCYFMASLGAVALRHPEVIRGMFTDNGDGTFAVRFYHNGQAEYVTVDRYAPVYTNGYLVYAGNSRAAKLPPGASPADFPVWAILAEKAYAQLNQSGWIGQDGTNSYNGIPASSDGGLNGGYGYDALGQITGRVAGADAGPLMITAARLAAQSHWAAVLSTPKDVNVAELVGSHAYALMAADDTGVVVANPWGKDKIGGVYATFLTWNQFYSNFDRIDAIVE
jgi:hypothetical protein